MGKKHKKDYDSTTPEPFKPRKNDHSEQKENPDKTKKIEKSDPTRKHRWDIISRGDSSDSDEEDTKTSLP